MFPPATTDNKNLHSSTFTLWKVRNGLRLTASMKPPGHFSVRSDQPEPSRPL